MFGRFETKGEFLLLCIGGEVERSFGGQVFLRERFALREKFQAEFSSAPRFMRRQSPFHLNVFLESRQGLVEQPAQDASRHGLVERFIRDGRAQVFNRQGMIVRRRQRRGSQEQGSEEKADHGNSLSTGEKAVKRVIGAYRLRLMSEAG